MDVTLNHGYPDRTGRRFIWAGHGSGPNPYVPATGDPVTIPGFQNYIDSVDGAWTVSGTYFIISRPSGAGPRQTWALHYYTLGGVEAGAIDLSAEVIQISGKGGTF